jgi:uncharacterized membrane protein
MGKNRYDSFILQIFLNTYYIPGAIEITEDQSERAALVELTSRAFMKYLLCTWSVLPLILIE